MVNSRWSKDVANPRRKSEAQSRAQTKNVSGISGCICVVLVEMQVRLVIAQPIDDVQGFAVVGADDLSMEGQAKVGGVAVDRRAASRTEVGRIAIGIGSVHCDFDAHAVG